LPLGAAGFSPLACLCGSKCTDLMDLGRGHNNFSGGLLRINSRGGPRFLWNIGVSLLLTCQLAVMIIGVYSDSLIPLSEQQYMYHLLQGESSRCTSPFRVLTSFSTRDSIQHMAKMSVCTRVVRISATTHFFSIWAGSCPTSEISWSATTTTPPSLPTHTRDRINNHSWKIVERKYLFLC